MSHKRALKSVAVVPMRGDDPLIQQVIRQPSMQTIMWEHAEHEIGEFDNVDLSVVLHEGVPVAWAGSKIYFEEGLDVLHCCLNFETVGLARQYGLYDLARRHRHLTVVKPCRLRSQAYLYEKSQVLRDHQDEGWVRTGRTGNTKNGSGNKWVELHRPASV